MIDEIAPFYRVLEQPDQVVEAAIRKNRPVIGYVCTYAPEELIFAAGGHPMRIFPEKQQISLADSHLQSYCCSQVRGILEQGLAGHLDFLDGMVFTHTCDAMQRLSDIWRMNLKPTFFADVVMPAKLDTPAGEQYMTAVLEQFKHEMTTLTGTRVSDQDLNRAIDLFNRIRSRLDKIYTIQATCPHLISGQQVLSIIKAAAIMDREQLEVDLASLACALENRCADSPALHAEPRRLVLSGPVCDLPDLFAIIENAGAVVAGDDLCTGQRGFHGTAPENLPPLERLTRRYLDRPICPSKHRGLTLRAKALIAKVKATGAHGVVFTLLKFCDPHAFDFPYLKAMLDKENIPCLQLELDVLNINAGQAATRLETFIQMI